MSRKCQFRRKNGTKCAADAQIGRDVCVFHDPDKAADGRRARREGGLQRSRPASVFPLEVPDASLKNSLDVSLLLAESINAVRKGQLDPRVSNAIGYLAGILVRALEQGPTEDRLARLETILGLAGNSQTGKLHREVAKEHATNPSGSN